jgi:aerobic carbon-monoxide dehydrogenase medium subunit
MDFVPAKDKAAALEYLAQHGAAAAVLAGGTNLMRQIALGLRAPAHFLYIGHLRELASVNHSGSGQGAQIGALVTLAELAQPATLGGRYQALCEAAATCGSGQIRNVGTIGGNLCNAAQHADLAAPLLLHDAVVTLESRHSGERTMPAAAFMQGEGATERLPDEVLTGIALAPVPARTADTYIKIGRRGAMELAIVGLAVRVTAAGGGDDVDDVRIAVGGVAPTAFRATDAEALLSGKTPTDDLIGEAAHALLRQAEPRDDFLATAAYRSTVLPGILARALQVCAARARAAA